MLVTPSAGPASSVISPSKADTQKSKKKAKGKGKAVDSDEDADGEEEDEDGIRVQPRDRTGSARQNMLQNDPKVFIKEQKRKAKQDMLDAAAANDSASSVDEIQEATTKAAKKPTTTKPKPAPKAPAPKKQPAARSKTTATQTIQNGRITKAANAEPKNDGRSHHKIKLPESAPCSSEDDGKNDNMRKLRTSIIQHAKWCPFVRLNKKMQNVHRRVRYLEGQKILKSQDDDSGEEEEVIAQVISDDNPDNNPEDEEDEEDGEDDEQPTETKQTTQTATKPATKKAAPKTPVTFKTLAASADNTQVENDDDPVSAVDDDEEEEKPSEREDGTRPAQDSSDDELSSLHAEDVEEGRKLLEELMTPRQEIEATSPFPSKGASGKKRKISDVDTALDVKEKAKGKKQRSSV